MYAMSEMPNTTPRVPALTLGWRLRMALGDIDAIDIADTLGVHRSTVARWMSDHGAPPKRAYILQWALITGVEPMWLESGKVPVQGGSGDGLRGGLQPSGWNYGSLVAA